MNNPTIGTLSKLAFYLGILANLLYVYLFLVKPYWWLYEEIFIRSNDSEKMLWFAVFLSPFLVAVVGHYISKENLNASA